MALSDPYDLANESGDDVVRALDTQSFEPAEQQRGLPQRKGLPDDDDDWFEPDYGSGRQSIEPN